MTSYQPPRVTQITDLLKACVRNGLVPDEVPIEVCHLAAVVHEARERGISLEEAAVALVTELIEQNYEPGQVEVAHALFALGRYAGIGIQRRHRAAIEADLGPDAPRRWEDWERVELTGYLQPLALGLWRRDQRAYEADQRPGRLIIIGGISGTGISPALREYGHRTGIPVISAEHELLLTAQQHWDAFRHLDEHSRPDLNLRSVLRLPDHIVAALWSEAFVSSIALQVGDALAQGDVMLNLHATYY